jgi:fructose-1,6-bisphosphatase/inositol monophosphatase family enzyme
MPGQYSLVEHEPTKEQVEWVKQIATRALNSALKKHTELGADGLQEVKKNQFGETALRMDIEAEEAVLESFTKDNFPVRVYSEEHGIVNIGEPKYLATLDGIDGTALYKEDRLHGKYGTMLGVLRGTNPQYSDYLFGGIMQHTTKRALVGIRGRGAFAISSDNEEQPIHTSGHTTFDKKTKMYVDEFFEICRETYSKPLTGFNIAYKKASSLYCADVAEGLADFASECTFKGNLEKAAAYGLIHEAGGVLVDITGNDIGAQKYLEFGQQEHVPVVTAATNELAQKLIAFLKNK